MFWNGKSLLQPFNIFSLPINVRSRKREIVERTLIIISRLSRQQKLAGQIRLSDNWSLSKRRHCVCLLILIEKPTPYSSYSLLGLQIVKEISFHCQIFVVRRWQPVWGQFHHRFVISFCADLYGEQRCRAYYHKSWV